MKLLITISCVIFSQIAFGQNQALDKKAGFKDIIIGDSKSKYLSFLKSPSPMDDGQTYYLYTSNNSNDYTAFGKVIDKILLSFDKNEKLVLIELLKEYKKDSYQTSLQDFTEMLDNLKGLFGSPPLNLSDDKKGNICYGWNGSKIFMMFQNEYLGFDTGSRNTITIMTNPVKENSKDF
jgi:hypothetical protein